MRSWDAPPSPGMGAPSDASGPASAPPPDPLAPAEPPEPAPPPPPPDPLLAPPAALDVVAPPPCPPDPCAVELAPPAELADVVPGPPGASLDLPHPSASKRASGAADRTAGRAMVLRDLHELARDEREQPEHETRHDAHERAR